MAKICNRSFLFLSLLVFLTATVAMASLLGAPKDVSFGDGGQENSLEIEELGKFAVDEHNKKENALVEFGKVVKAKTQVVAGTMYHLTLEAIEGGKKKIYEAKVWVKPWMHFKELQEFKHVNDCITSSDLGAKQEGHGSGWRMLPAHDPVVQEAADIAVKSLQQKSNSLAPYELLEILHAKAEIIEEEETANLDMLLKLKRGSMEEKFKFGMHKNVGGGHYLVNHMQQEP